MDVQGFFNPEVYLRRDFIISLIDSSYFYMYNISDHIHPILPSLIQQQHLTNGYTTEDNEIIPSGKVT